MESYTAPIPGHRVGEAGLIALGLTAGTHFDWVDATGFPAATLSDYSAIAVIDRDINGIATTLAGNVRIDNGGFTPVPEPGSLLLLASGLTLPLALSKYRKPRV